MCVCVCVCAPTRLLLLQRFNEGENCLPKASANSDMKRQKERERSSILQFHRHSPYFSGSEDTEQLGGSHGDFFDVSEEEDGERK